MAYAFKDIATKLGLTPVLLQGLEEAGLNVVVGKTSIKFGKNGEVLGTVPISEQALAKLMDGSAGAIVTKSMKDNLVTAITVVTAKVGKGNSPLHSQIDQDEDEEKEDQIEQDSDLMGELEITDGDPVFGSSLSEKTPAKVKAVPETPIVFPGSVGELKACSAYEMKSEPPISLANATMLYQPVKGSNDSSRYFCLAICDLPGKELKIGARFTSKKLSVRFEGKIPVWSPILKELGVTVHSSTYASIHLNAENSIVASKVVGALMLGTGAPFKSPLPQLKIIEGKGV